MQESVQPEALPAALPGAQKQATFWQSLRIGLVYYLVTTLIVLAGAAFGYWALARPPREGVGQEELLTPLLRWDGRWYERIARNGYAYDPSRESSVAFFPAYPLLARTVTEATGIDLQWSLLLVSHLCLAGTFVVFAMYVKNQFSQGPSDLAGFVLLAFGLWPTNFFFRMAYTESLFLFVTLLIVYGMRRAWPLWVLGTLVGLLTAVRPVGVVMTAPFALHIWQRRTSRTRLLVDVALPAILSCAGLAAYMLYQRVHFGYAFAFAQTQTHWQIAPRVSFLDRMVALETLQPVWSIFDGHAWALWTAVDPKARSLFNAPIMDRVFFLLAAGLLGVAAVRRSLPSEELVAGGLLLLIPYLSRGYEMNMASMGRFSAVVFPIYLVLGRFLCRLPAPCAAGLMAGSASLLVIYTAQFAAGFWFL